MTAAVRSLDQVTERLLAARPAVLLIAVDTYDEVLKEMKDSGHTRRNFFR